MIRVPDWLRRLVKRKPLPKDSPPFPPFGDPPRRWFRRGP